MCVPPTHEGSRSVGDSPFPSTGPDSTGSRGSSSVAPAVRVGRSVGSTTIDDGVGDDDEADADGTARRVEFFEFEFVGDARARERVARVVREEPDEDADDVAGDAGATRG